MSTAGTPVYFVPSFQDLTPTTSFFENFPSLHGAFNWNAWPYTTDGTVAVPTKEDEVYIESAAAVNAEAALTKRDDGSATNKTFMMGISPLQFKHLDSSNNWYRRGEENLEVRFGQALSMQPDFIEFQTWNDAGESHYMGNTWLDPINGSLQVDYSQPYPHTGYLQILPSFIKAYKNGSSDTSKMYPTNGANAQGTFWHHTLLKDGNCYVDGSKDSYGLSKPDGADGVEDKVTAVVLIAEGVTGYGVSISSGGTTLGTQTLVPGFNSFIVDGLETGTVIVTVTDGSSSTVVSGTGPIDVVDDTDLCNYNFQVVGLA